MTLGPYEANILATVSDKLAGNMGGMNDNEAARGHPDFMRLRLRACHDAPKTKLFMCLPARGHELLSGERLYRRWDAPES